MKRFGVLLPVVLLASACPSSSNTADGGTGDGGVMRPLMSVTSVDPAEGSAGITVTVRGFGFQDGALVRFGSVSATQTQFQSDRALTAVVPSQAAGRVGITVVNPDGTSAILPNGFLNVLTIPPSIEDSSLETLPAEDHSETNPVLFPVSGWVRVRGVTGDAGVAAGVKAQFGFAKYAATKPMAFEYTWTPGTFAGDQVTDADRFTATLSIPGASGRVETDYYVMARFSMDDGVTWVMADADGSANGELSPHVLRVGRKIIEWCKLDGEATQSAPIYDVRLGSVGPPVLGQVYLGGVTDMAGAPAGIEGQVGLGSMTTPLESFAWFPAAYGRDTNNAHNDEFTAPLPTQFEGTFFVAYRFSVNGGPWRFCGANGLLTNTDLALFSGRATVTPVRVDACNLQFPTASVSFEGDPLGPMYGRVRMASITEAAGAGAGVEAQFGLGSSGQPVDQWAWSPASYNVEIGNGVEEWQATVSTPDAGQYAMAYRFRYDGGTWSYCDTQLDGTFDPLLAGTLTAYNTSTPIIASCTLQSVSAASVPSGNQVTAVASVRIPGFSADAGATPGVRAQVGVGTTGDNASTSAAWGWQEASFFEDVADGGEDAFRATFQPAYSGTRAVSFRFSVNDGGTWTYCDSNGSNVMGYEVAQQPSLSVGVPAALEYCVLQAPATVVQSASGMTTIYGQVFQTGVTLPPGADSSIHAELGIGPKIEDPGVSSSWRWINASYNSLCTNCGSNDEYSASFTAPAGAHHYVFRFTRDNGVSYCFADLDGAGSTTGTFNGETSSGQENLGKATVNP